MLDAGATAYVSLQAEEQEWIAALRRAQVGQRFLSADVARNLAFHSLEGGITETPLPSFPDVSSRSPTW